MPHLCIRAIRQQPLTKTKNLCNHQILFYHEILKQKMLIPNNITLVFKPDYVGIGLIALAVLAVLVINKKLL